MLTRLRTTPRGLEFGSLHETLLITGIATILVIRTQLWLTNYPQLGGRGLHIAHLLWGGMFMLISIGLLLTFLGRPVRRLAAIVGGVGFGFFIDELGKFITADNNYFYKPAAALIYLIFIGLFMATRALQRDRPGARDELANAVDLLGDAARHDLDEAGRRRALALLDRADQHDPLVVPLRGVFEELEPRAPVRPGPASRAVARVRADAERFVAWSGFEACLSWLFGAWAVLSALGVMELVFSVGIDLGTAHRGYASDRFDDLAFVNIASLASSFASALLVGRGVLRLRQGRRPAAYRDFERALLVAIFVTQVFAFVESQFGAVFGLAVDLLLLVGLRSVRARDAGRPPAQPAGAFTEATYPRTSAAGSV